MLAQEQEHYVATNTFEIQPEVPNLTCVLKNLPEVVTRSKQSLRNLQKELAMNRSSTSCWLMKAC